MELQQMRYVAAIAEEQNFTRAAERCFVVQSALSHQIKALERELGVKLFARSSRRVELTAAGEAFLVQARASLDAADRAVSAAAAANGEIRGTLTVGVIPTVTTIDIPPPLAHSTALILQSESSFTVGEATNSSLRSRRAAWMWQSSGFRTARHLQE